MAKQKLNFDDRRLRIKSTERVKEIRARYARAIELGHSVAEASRLANCFEEITRVDPPLLTVEDLSEAPSQEEQEAPQVVGHQKIDIPANYRELPWPELVKLAVAVTGSDEYVKSRAQACRLIEAKLEAEREQHDRET